MKGEIEKIMIKVLFVCLGNICRSPMAEFILKDIVNKKGKKDEFYIDSESTSKENEIARLGIYPETKEILIKNNIPFEEHISRQIRKEDYDKFDYILVMEEKNIYGVLKIVGTDLNNKIHRLLDFTKKPKDIADPWYYGNFDLTYKEIKYGCESFIEYLNRN